MFFSANFTQTERLERLTIDSFKNETMRLVAEKRLAVPQPSLPIRGRVAFRAGPRKQPRDHSADSGHIA
jgi:hypothetical protein